jgi:inosose dehydratase
MQLPPERVLGEMRDLGIKATELGALGWLPTDAAALRTMLDDHGLQLVGGFVPLVMHRADRRAELEADALTAARTLAEGGGTCFVTAAVSSHEVWQHLDLDDQQWANVVEGLDLVERICADHGLTQVVHPHVNTLIETAAEFDRFLADSTVRFCLDTGHLFIGGADPVAIARQHSERIGLVHIKDVNAAVAARMCAGEFDLMGATMAGLFPAAGQGDVSLAEVLATMEQSVFHGWYVLEQDVALTGGEPPVGEGPMVEIRVSLDYLRSLDAPVAAS